MKFKVLVAIIVSVVASQAMAQKQNYDKSTRFIYNLISYGSDKNDTSTTEIYRQDERIYIISDKVEGVPIPGYSIECTIADYAADSISYEVSYPNETYRAMSSLSRRDIVWDSVEMKGNKIKYICSINSNRLEFVVQKGVRYEVSPMPSYGRLGGVLLEFWRNGQKLMELARWDKKQVPAQNSSSNVMRVSGRDLNRIKTEHLVQTTRIFDDVQLCWGKKNAHLDGEMAFDSVYHFAGGTLAMKRIKLPQLPTHYQHFMELHQHSNGDAYDRTGSVFVIPHRMSRTFFEGMNNHPDSLPIMVDRAGNKFQGISLTDNYEPIVELIRFFTPFGVGHFNDRVRIDGIEWRDEAYYKQDVTELSDLLSGDVWIGVFIGNYDGGGHKVTLDLKSYPQSYVLGSVEKRYREIIPLFTTTNVLEMAGQNYGQLFGGDSLTVSFEIPEGTENVRLRYLTTGHGGWGGGDEFNPKPNTIIIDGKKCFEYTPWRCDCGRYREWNPVSGTSWDGTTSSDYSRSGWCPGTATQPTYFDLGMMTPGTHTITVAIPQGAPIQGGLSFWNVSGTLLVE